MILILKRNIKKEFGVIGYRTQMSIFRNQQNAKRKKWLNQFKNQFSKLFKEYLVGIFRWRILSSCENHCNLSHSLCFTTYVRFFQQLLQGDADQQLFLYVTSSYRTWRASRVSCTTPSSTASPRRRSSTASTSRSTTSPSPPCQSLCLLFQNRNEEK